MIGYKLLSATRQGWGEYVVQHLEEFLIDHAACERKASASAMHFVVKYPDKVELMDRMIAIAREELEHFEQVVGLIRERGLSFSKDSKDPYVSRLMKHMSDGIDKRFMDRLILGSIIEFRGCERFVLVSNALKKSDPELSAYYKQLAAEESKHRGDFIEMACLYFDEEEVKKRLDELLIIEATIVDELPTRAALH